MFENNKCIGHAVGGAVVGVAGHYSLWRLNNFTREDILASFVLLFDHCRFLTTINKATFQGFFHRIVQLSFHSGNGNTKSFIPKFFEAVSTRDSRFVTFIIRMAINIKLEKKIEEIKRHINIERT